MSFTDFNGVVSQEVLDYERAVVAGAVETEDLSVVVQELFLRCNFTSAEFLLKVLEHECIALGSDGDLRFLERIGRAFLSGGALLSAFHEELSRVIITIVNAELTSIDADVAAYGEILRHERLLGSVTLENHMSLKESALRNSTVGLLGLGDHDRLILKIVENGGFADSEVFEAAFNNALFGVGVKSQDLLVKLNESRLELLSDFCTATQVVGVLGVGERLGGFSLVSSEVGRWGVGNGVQRYGNVLVVSNFLEMYM